MYVYIHAVEFSDSVVECLTCSLPSERALYSFECNFHPMFNYTQGNCHLDYKYQENR